MLNQYIELKRKKLDRYEQLKQTKEDDYDKLYQNYKDDELAKFRDLVRKLRDDFNEVSNAYWSQ